MLAGASESNFNSEQDTEQRQDEAKQQQRIWLMWWVLNNMQRRYQSRLVLVTCASTYAPGSCRRMNASCWFTDMVCDCAVGHGIQCCLSLQTQA